MKISMRWVVPVLLLTLAACGDDDDDSSGNGGSGGSGNAATLSFDQCSQACLGKATTCQAPTSQARQICDPLCAAGVTQGQADCLVAKDCSQLSSIGSPEQFRAVCPAGGGAGGAGGAGGGGGALGKFGDDCKCKADSSEGSGEFLCSSTSGPCESGLSCVGSRTQGVDSGTCVGPTCCTSEQDCATKLGTQSSCGSDQVCACPFGDFECVGTTCTCAGGVAPSRGLCHPK